MENWPVFVAILVIHFVMFVATTFSIYTCPHRTLFEKFCLMLVALLIPIIGPLYINYKLGHPPVKNGKFINTDFTYDSDYSSSGDSGSSSDSGGGGGD